MSETNDNGPDSIILKPAKLSMMCTLLLGTDLCLDGIPEHIQQAAAKLQTILSLKQQSMSLGPKITRKSELIGADGALACTLILDEIIKSLN